MRGGKVTKKKIYELLGTRAKFNEDYYFSRDNYEKEYESALYENKCIIVRGDSGCGKTWLTKHVLNSNNCEYEIVNLSNIDSSKGLSYYFLKKLGMVPTELYQEKNVKTSFGFPVEAGAGMTTKRGYTFYNNEYMSFLKKYCKNKYLIFDNFETIINHDNIVEELRNIINNVDDDEVLELGVKIILIGANSDILSFFEKLPSHETISNRVCELKEIKGFSKQECTDYLHGVFKKIGFKIDMASPIWNDIFNITKGIPQSVKDYCCKLANIYFDNNIFEIDFNSKEYKDYRELALKKWLEGSFSGHYAVVSKLFYDNLKDKSTIRYNYILFILQEMNRNEFSSENVHYELSTYFSDCDSILVKLGKNTIKGYLEELSASDMNTNILEKKGENYYSIRNNKTLLCMSAMLYLDNDDVRIVDILETGKE